uniref:AMP-binding protein n=1 Tax=Phenylobacterium glaciei TaxID=2803784 RepID=A0A974P789_9CAUL|nr:AMP-binding protein [Phenylobacterium glaciei]
MKQVIGRMHMSGVTIAYGMTETSPVSFQSAQDDPMDRRVGTVGRVQPHLECKVVDLEGNTPPRGETGELCTRGYSVMLGYWDDAEKTAEAIDADGWMHTGDLAVIDAAGYGNIVGRIKDMVIRGGEKVYPARWRSTSTAIRRSRTSPWWASPTPLRRGALRLDPPQARRDRHRSRGHGLLPRPDRPLQDPRYVRFVDAFP